MKKSIVVTSFLPTVTVIIALFFLPDIVPNTLFNIGRIGVAFSKYYDLLWGAFALVLGIAVSITVFREVEKERPLNEKLFRVISANVAMILLEVFTVWRLWKQI